MEDKKTDRFLDKMLHDAKLLSDADTLRLIALAQKGDMDARNRVVQGNLRFIYVLAKKFSPQNRNILSDLINEGCIGMSRAVIMFDSTKNVRFLSYAVNWVKNHMQAFLRDDVKIRLPADIYVLIRRVKKRFNQGVDPTLDQLIDEFDLEPTKAELILSVIGRREVSLDTPVDHDDSLYLGDIIPDQDQQDASELDEMATDVMKVYNDAKCLLDERQQKVIELSFFHKGGGSLQTVGNELGLTKERVRQIKQKALLIIRKYALSGDKLEDYRE